MKKPGFFAGIRYFLRGFKLIRAAGVRRFVIIPLAINIMLFAGAIFWGLSWVGDLMNHLEVTMTSDLEGDMQWLATLFYWSRWVIISLAVIIMLAIMFYTFTLIANLIAAPFNSLLAEKIEDHLTGKTVTHSGSIIDVIRDASGSFLSELRKLRYFALRAIPLLVLFFIPGINFIAAPLWLLFSAWMLAIEYSDFPMGNHAIRFPGQCQTLKGNKFFALGFGAATMAVTMIPIINFIAMPVAVAGSTAMWLEYWKDNIPQTAIQ